MKNQLKKNEKSEPVDGIDMSRACIRALHDDEMKALIEQNGWMGELPSGWKVMTIAPIDEVAR